jgi:HEPN domain-containing protein
VSSPGLEPAEVAAILFRKAEGDAKAMRKLTADPEMDDEVVGFHAQQAVEKWLKAVVASRGENFEHTHDLRRLLSLARLDSTNSPFDIGEVVALTEYAVPFRYEDLLDAEPLDRDAALILVGKVGGWAKAQLGR